MVIISERFQSIRRRFGTLLGNIGLINMIIILFHMIIIQARNLFLVIFLKERKKRLICVSMFEFISIKLGSV